MKKIITGIAVVLLMALAFTACQKNDMGPENKIIGTQLTPQQVQQVALMKEASLAIGKTIKNSEARNYIVKLVRVKNDNSEAISMAALLGDQANITKYEKDLLAKGFKQNNKSVLDKSFFAKELLNIIYNNSAEYPMLSKNLPHNKSSASTIDKLNALRKELAAQNLEIYLPYRQEFKWNSISKVTVTWDPLTQDSISQGVIIPVSNLKSATAQPVSNINENYVSTEPTLLVRPIDPVDYTNGGSGSGTGNTGVNSEWLTTNIDYTKVPESDIILVTIPKVKLNKNYRWWIGGSSQITIYRASGDLKFDNTGDLIPSASIYRLIRQKKISRYDVKNHNWVGVNIIWDDDWQKHENTEQFILVSYQGDLVVTSPSLVIKGTTKIGYDLVKRKVSATATLDAAFEIKLGPHNILRYNNQISRRSLLSHVVGGILHDDDGNLIVKNVNGVPYTVRKADELEYYFNINWTHVAN